MEYPDLGISIDNYVAVVEMQRPPNNFFDTELIKHFVVVHWDQRGAGKSYSPQIPPESMTRAQFVSDI